MFTKEWTFNLKHHQIHIAYNYFDGMKLYVDGDLRDFSELNLSFRDDVLLKANLPEIGIIDVTPSLLFLALKSQCNFPKLQTGLSSTPLTSEYRCAHSAL